MVWHRTSFRIMYKICKCNFAKLFSSVSNASWSSSVSVGNSIVYPKLIIEIKYWLYLSRLGVWNLCMWFILHEELRWMRVYKIFQNYWHNIEQLSLLLQSDSVENCSTLILLYFVVTFVSLIEEVPLKIMMILNTASHHS